ncbi:MAG: polysaccharide pyruvyl transferase family protein [Lachnospiraceae bacterium]|nr:polysaccharide pyruvyl transferase family protein [Lachnospiraceae bacterium]
MKIGILSMQRVVNYGSFLQAYGLMNTIKSLGHDVEFVDYTVEPVLVQTEHKKYNKLFEKMKQRCRILKKKYIARRDSKVFEDFQDFRNRYENEYLPMIGVTHERNITPELDCLVIGSDEVFNCLQTNENVGYSRELFGANTKAKKIISYAGSFGNTTLKGLEKYHIDQEIKNYFDRFDAISVRDDNSYEIVNKLVDKPIEKNLDPVLIYNFSEEVSKVELKHKYDRYIVLYAYTGRINEKEADAIVKFAKKNDAKVIAIGGTFLFCDECIFPSPFETLKLIQNAMYVITDTFHGSVFSIKFNKQFCVFVRNGEEKVYGNSQKIVDLLRGFELEDRIVTELDTMDNILENKINYEFVNDRIANERKHTREYLERVCN